MKLCRRSRGLTLIEILLSLLVMVLGILGVMAVFPVAMQSGKESMEETTATILAESIYHSMVSGFRFANHIVGPPSETRVTLSHDLQQTTAIVSQYTFSLPKLPPTMTEPFWRHPGAPFTGTLATTPVDQMTPEQLFRVCGDAWVAASIDTVRERYDGSEVYRQFAFAFEVQKINNLQYLINKPNPDKPPTSYQLADLEPLVRLYEFRIHVFRLSQQAAVTGTSSTGTTSDPGTSSCRYITTLVKRISVK